MFQDFVSVTQKKLQIQPPQLLYMEFHSEFQLRSEEDRNVFSKEVLKFLFKPRQRHVVISNVRLLTAKNIQARRCDVSHHRDRCTKHLLHAELFSEDFEVVDEALRSSHHLL